MVSLEVGKFVLVEDTDMYEVVGDYTEVSTPLDYELQNINNTDDEIAVSESTVNRNLGNRWKIIDL